MTPFHSHKPEIKQLILWEEAKSDLILLSFNKIFDMQNQFRGNVAQELTGRQRACKPADGNGCNLACWAGFKSTNRQGKERYLFIPACTNPQAVLTVIVVTSPKASPQVTGEELLIKPISRPGRCASFLLARAMFLQLL